MNPTLIFLSLILALMSCLFDPARAGTGQDAPARESRGELNPPLPDLSEVSRLIEQNLPGVTHQDVVRAALEGILTEFQSKIDLVLQGDGGKARTSTGIVQDAKTLNPGVAYFRLSRIAADTGEAVTTAWRRLNQPDPAKGLVLDLRGTHGKDYQGVIDVLGLFTVGPHPLFDAGSGLRSTPKTPRLIHVPAVLLINGQTRGAAEVISALFRDFELGLLIGQPTAGQGQVFNEIPLSGGHLLLIATSAVRLASGASMPADGVQPDILVQPPSPPHPARNRPVEPPVSGAAPSSPFDGTLARALDLLKGLSIVEQFQGP